MKCHFAWILALWMGGQLAAQESLPPVKKGNSAAPKSNASGKSSGNSKSSSAPAGGSSNSGTSKPGNPAGQNSGAAAPRGKAPDTGRAANTANDAKRSENTSKSLTPAIKEQVSYAIGLDLATRFKSEGDDVNFDMVLKGLKDGYAGTKPAYSDEQLRASMEVFQQYMQVKAQEQLKSFAADNAAFLDTNKKKSGVKVTKSGLQYQVLKSGSGKSPKTGDWIRAHYHGTFIDGNVFETTTMEGGQPVEIAVEDTIPGWTEALAMMKPGDQWRLFIPPDLAYGAAGNGPVPPHATLIFDLELLEIIPPPKTETVPPPKTEIDSKSGQKEAKSKQLLK